MCFGVIVFFPFDFGCGRCAMLIPNDVLSVIIDFVFARNIRLWIAPVFVCKQWNAVCEHNTEFKRYRTREVALLTLKYLAIRPNISEGGMSLTFHEYQGQIINPARFYIIHDIMRQKQWSISEDGYTHALDWNLCRRRLIREIRLYPQCAFAIIHPKPEIQWPCGLYKHCVLWTAGLERKNDIRHSIYVPWEILCNMVDERPEFIGSLMQKYKRQKALSKDHRKEYLYDKSWCVVQ